jgi:hypothetical protein
MTEEVEETVVVEIGDHAGNQYAKAKAEAKIVKEKGTGHTCPFFFFCL